MFENWDILGTMFGNYIYFLNLVCIRKSLNNQIHLT